jgi:hypothetical protein
MKFRENDPLTLEVYNERLRYEPDTGLFRWNYTRSYKAKRDDVAGSLGRDGYIRLSINGLPYFGHRLAWFAVHGKWPEAEIDHVNGVKSDNRLCNLRAADRVLNMQNQKRAHSGQQSGLLGVYPINTGGFTSFIQVDRKRIYLGYFKTAEAAHETYLEAKRQLHPGNTL